MYVGTAEQTHGRIEWASISILRTTTVLTIVRGQPHGESDLMKERGKEGEKEREH